MTFDGGGAWFDGEYFTDLTWRRLPLSLRRKWWRQCGFGTKPPSPALLSEVAAMLDRIAEQKAKQQKVGAEGTTTAPAPSDAH
jgi:hypothetical protein